MLLKQGLIEVQNDCIVVKPGLGDFETTKLQLATALGYCLETLLVSLNLMQLWKFKTLVMQELV